MGLNRLNVRPSRRSQIQALTQDVIYLRARLSALGADDPEDVCPTWARGMSRQMIETVHLLVKAYPRTVSHDYLMDNISHYGAVEYASETVIKTIVCRVRKHLGSEAVETRWGLGYCAGADLVGIVKGRGKGGDTPNPLANGSSGYEPARRVG